MSGGSQKLLLLENIYVCLGQFGYVHPLFQL